jgi:ATP-dependent RNA helicase SUPV3L1/SUV3
LGTESLQEIPDFAAIRNLLESERRTIIKINKFSEEDEYVRSVEDAGLVLDLVEEIQTKLDKFFKEYPSLTSKFNKDYISYIEFINRDFVLDLIFLDDCLFPEKEMFYFGQDGGLSPEFFKLHIKSIDEWCEVTEGDHTKTQTTLKENFDIDLKMSEMNCHCVKCVADYRAFTRDKVFEDCKEVISNIETEMSTLLDEGVEDVNDTYRELQKKLDRIFHKVRTRLKRSTINRLDSQVKSIVRDRFTYPSDLAKRREVVLKPILIRMLEEQELSPEIIEESEYKRFFNQIKTNIWRNEHYIGREFNKMVKSLLLLKRKDISGTILQEYLGEFWVHSQARKIKRKIVYHMGPTNSGKTYHAIQRLCEVHTGCYLAPLRLLAAELYDTMNQKGAVTTLLTGEEVIEIEGSTHYSSTIEMARLQEHFDCCVIDEIQMITDPQRGWAWTRALVNISADEVHICGDPSVLELVKMIVEMCGDEMEIKNYERMTELNVEKKAITLGNLDRSDALIVFSRRQALKYKMDLERLNFKVSIVYGRLSPEVRREQARKFDQGETDIMVSTDAIAMGMNLPIKRIVFSTLSKFFNNQEHVISASEIKQIAGRAGRYQRFPVGFVSCLTRVEDGIDQIEEAINATLDQKKKCMVGPDLDIFSQVNKALEDNNLPMLRLSEFLRLFNTMQFKKPFFCVELGEMIDLAEIVEEANSEEVLSSSEIFGFTCAPVNQGLLEHVQYFVWILNKYVNNDPIFFDPIDPNSDDIDYLETTIKCVELYQWLARHFDNKNFSFDDEVLHANKSLAVEKLNLLLSNKIVPTCSSCGQKIEENSKFAICEACFKQRRYGGSSRGRSGGGKAGSARRGSRPGKPTPGTRDKNAKKKSRKRKFNKR